jgi:hypothetical protein
MDSSEVRLKGVLLHNGSKSSSIPLVHEVHMKETYEKLGVVKYAMENTRLDVCGDLKFMAMLTGLQGGYTKFSCV